MNPCSHKASVYFPEFLENVTPHQCRYWGNLPLRACVELGHFLKNLRVQFIHPHSPCSRRHQSLGHPKWAGHWAFVSICHASPKAWWGLNESRSIVQQVWFQLGVASMWHLPFPFTHNHFILSPRGWTEIFPATTNWSSSHANWILFATLAHWGHWTTLSTYSFLILGPTQLRINASYMTLGLPWNLVLFFFFPFFQIMLISFLTQKP